jgi:predicted kinase
MEKPILYILTGLPYAGKTTLRNELVKRFKMRVISIDEINDEWGVIAEQITQKDWDKVYTEAYKRLKEYLSQGKKVVFDGASLLFRERETQRQIAESIGAAYKLIYVDTPQEEIKERWMKNQQTKDRGHVPEKLFEAALTMWEEPRAEEHPLIYNQNMDLDNWISQNIK